MREQLRRVFVWLSTSGCAATCAGGTPSDDHSSLGFEVIFYAWLPSRTKPNKHMQRSRHHVVSTLLKNRVTYEGATKPISSWVSAWIVMRPLNMSPLSYVCP